MTLEVRDAAVELRPDPSRVVAGLFLPGASTPGAGSRATQVTARLRALPAADIADGARRLEREFGTIGSVLVGNAEKVEPHVTDDALRLVLGGLFTAEHAVEGAALCNPSAVPHPDQSGLAPGALRIAVSLRSIGEGHVSAISFCTAVIGPSRNWSFEERRAPAVRPAITEGGWDLDRLRSMLELDGPVSDVAHAVLEHLPERVHGSHIEAAIAELPVELLAHRDARAHLEALRLVGRSAYEAVFPDGSELSQRVLLPAVDEERQGLEDARFVRFVEDDGGVEYRASYTAFDGQSISSRRLTTTDFVRFSAHPLAGAGSRTKGMAFFPRRVGGRQLALTRSDGERILLAGSDDGMRWDDERLVAAPEHLWEIVQLGNAGPPIETDRGWLVLTHGVGPMRRYSLGAILLDLDDPSRLIARSTTPFLEPIGPARHGYVPNVVYSCGGVVHDGVLWLPYGIGDGYIRVASIVVADLIGSMLAV